MTSKNITSASKISFKNDLLLSQFMTMIKNEIESKMKAIDLNKFRTNPDLVLITCDIVWNACSDLAISDSDLNKQQLALDVLTNLCCYTPVEIANCKDQITYIVNHNQITIVKDSNISKVWKLFKKGILLSLTK